MKKAINRPWRGSLLYLQKSVTINRSMQNFLIQFQKPSILPSASSHRLPILFLDGERFNLSNLRVLYNDEDNDIKSQMRSEVNLSSIRNRDRMSVESMLMIAKPTVRDVLCKVTHLVQTIIPETFRLFKGNSKGVLKNPTGICIGEHGSLFITDNNKSRLMTARLHYPVDLTEVSKSLKNPNGVAFINGVVFVADTGNRRVAYKAVGPSVFLSPKKMKISELRSELAKRGKHIHDSASKSVLVKELSKWIEQKRKEVYYSESDINTLLLNTEMIKPQAIIAAATDLLMISDNHSVYQVSVSNNGAFLEGTANLLIELSQTSRIFGLAYDGENLYISDSSKNGGITKLNLATSESVMIVRNGTMLCKTVHGVAVSAEGNVIFTDRDLGSICMEYHQNHILLIKPYHL